MVHVDVQWFSNRLTGVFKRPSAATLVCVFILCEFLIHIRVNRFNTIRLIKYILTLSLLLFFFIAKNSISFCTNPLVFRSYRGACAVLLCRHTILQLWILGRSCDVHMPIRDSYIRFYSFVICQRMVHN